MEEWSQVVCKINLRLPYASTHANPYIGKYCMYIHTHWILSRGCVLWTLLEGRKMGRATRLKEAG